MIEGMLHALFLKSRGNLAGQKKNIDLGVQRESTNGTFTERFRDPSLPETSLRTSPTQFN